MVVIAGEYLELSSPTCAKEVIDTLTTVLGVPAAAWRASVDPLWRLEHQQVEMILDDCSDGPGTVRLALGDLDDSTTARRAAGRIYRHLAATTPWTVVWTTDTTTGASDPAHPGGASPRPLTSPRH